MTETRGFIRSCAARKKRHHDEFPSWVEQEMLFQATTDTTVENAPPDSHLLRDNNTECSWIYVATSNKQEQEQQQASPRRMEPSLLWQIARTRTSSTCRTQYYYYKHYRLMDQ